MIRIVSNAPNSGGDPEEVSWTREAGFTCIAVH